MLEAKLKTWPTAQAAVSTATQKGNAERRRATGTSVVLFDNVSPEAGPEQALWRRMLSTWRSACRRSPRARQGSPSTSRARHLVRRAQDLPAPGRDLRAGADGDRPRRRQSALQHRLQAVAGSVAGNTEARGPIRIFAGRAIGRKTGCHFNDRALAASHAADLFHPPRGDGLECRAPHSGPSRCSHQCDGRRQASRNGAHCPRRSARPAPSIRLQPPNPGVGNHGDRAPGDGARPEAYRTDPPARNP